LVFLIHTEYMQCLQVHIVTSSTSIQISGTWTFSPCRQRCSYLRLKILKQWIFRALARIRRGRINQHLSVSAHITTKMWIFVFAQRIFDIAIPLFEWFGFASRLNDACRRICQ